MIKRIRYTKDSDGLMVSTRMIPVTSGEVSVKYNPDSRVVLIVSGEGIVVENWVATTNHELKKSIKAKLVQMGAAFDKESRERQ
jgi:hypothetical protein